MIKVSLDGDDQTTVEIKKVDEMNSMDDLLTKCAKKFKVGDPAAYGLKTLKQDILL